MPGQRRPTTREFFCAFSLPHIGCCLHTSDFNLPTSVCLMSGKPSARSGRVRRSRSSPSLTIAVGIGANTALFSVYDRLVLNPVTIPNPSSLVAIWTNNPQLNLNAPGRCRGRATRSFENTRARSASIGDLGVRQFHADRQRRSGAAEQPARQRLVLSDARHPAGGRPQFHRRRGSAQRSGGLHHQPRAVADALRRPSVARERDHHAQRPAVAGGRHHAAAAVAAVRAGAGLRAARIRGRRVSRRNRSRTAPATRSRSRG